jgi:hypothetical protein
MSALFANISFFNNRTAERALCRDGGGSWSQRRRSALGSQRCRATPSPERDQKNSPSRFRFRPPLPLTFAFRLLPSVSASTYLRSALGARRNLTRCTKGSRGRKEACPQFASISFFNISTAKFPTCGRPCGKKSQRRPNRRQAGATSGSVTRSTTLTRNPSTRRANRATSTAQPRPTKMPANTSPG